MGSVLATQRDHTLGTADDSCRDGHSEWGASPWRARGKAASQRQQASQRGCQTDKREPGKKRRGDTCTPMFIAALFTTART